MITGTSGARSRPFERILGAWRRPWGGALLAGAAAVLLGSGSASAGELRTGPLRLEIPELWRAIDIGRARATVTQPGAEQSIRCIVEAPAHGVRGVIAMGARSNGASSSSSDSSFCRDLTADRGTRVIEPPERVTFGSHRALRTEIEVTRRGLPFRQIIYRYDTTASVVLVLSAPRDSFSDYAETFESIAASVVVERMPDAAQAGFHWLWALIIGASTAIGAAQILVSRCSGSRSWDAPFRLTRRRGIGGKQPVPVSTGTPTLR